MRFLEDDPHLFLGRPLSIARGAMISQWTTKIDAFNTSQSNDAPVYLISRMLRLLVHLAKIAFQERFEIYVPLNPLEHALTSTL